MTERSSQSDAVILVRATLKANTDTTIESYIIEESKGLVMALGLCVPIIHHFSMRAPRAATFLHKGIIEKIAEDVALLKPAFVLVDGALSPIQQRNLEKLFSAKVLDRTELILRIFSQRAESSEGSLQVELASLIYQKSRLVRTWTHLERQTGGFGFLAGPGESQLEVDRRLINQRIDVIRHKLTQVAKTRSIQRSARAKARTPVVALVGYTNAGKSTVFNALTASSVVAADMLFATLDPRMRYLKLPSGRAIAVTDTVGFISDLPHQLVAAFKATLEEVVLADLIIHVHDCTSPLYAYQNEAVHDILAELGMSQHDAAGKCIHALNKIDVLLAPQEQDKIKIDFHQNDSHVVAISAKTREGLKTLLAEIDAILGAGRRQYLFDLPVKSGAAMAWLYDRGASPEWVTTKDEESKIVAWLRDDEYHEFKSKFL